MVKSSYHAQIALLPLVVGGEIDFGMFIGIIGGVFFLSKEFSWGVSGTIKDITGHREFLNDLTDFMALEDYPGAELTRQENMVFDTIEFVNVSFRYPDSDKLILNGISFKIKAGNHYSFVGANGAGKTTITKLLTGLYDNYTGDILIDGRNLREFTGTEIKGLSSVVYQDFARYSISLYDNIVLSKNMESSPTKTDKRVQAQAAIELMELSELSKKLPNGLDTPLGKILPNGVDLSGGEWQRVAMARCVASDAPLKILDEPTAALDPISESLVYKNFERISKGSTTIFISHRLGSTKLADTIFVLHDGKIVESGSHHELMTTPDGIYREMWEAQAQWYTQV